MQSKWKKRLYEIQLVKESESNIPALYTVIVPEQGRSVCTPADSAQNAGHILGHAGHSSGRLLRLAGNGNLADLSGPSEVFPSRRRPKGAADSHNMYVAVDAVCFSNPFRESHRHTSTAQQ